ncbi:MAG: exo-alpha-sialidase [Kiritimatiellae bacterium]|nr:exo-alpha-sialidase [Kiritimatiellia bacterium]
MNSALIDISGEVSRQTIIAAGTTDTYQGHPTTVLTRTGKLICVWTLGHGGPCGPAAESLDGGRTWTHIEDRLPPEYATQCRNCPTLQKMALPAGRERLLIFSARPPSGDVHVGPCPLGIVFSDDDGATWRMAPPAEVSAMMPPTGFIQFKDGSVALFGQVFKSQEQAKDRPTDDQNVWMATSNDGLSWSAPRIIAAVPEKNLCEPFAIRSPDGAEIALLLRENRHTACSMMCFSRDEGATWTAPVDTAPELSGDRHEGIVLPDGRLFIAFRDRMIDSPTYGQYVAWVGTYEDLRNARPGACRIHLLKSWAGAKAPDGTQIEGWNCDTGYSGVELLPNGELLCTTYTKHWPDARKHSVVSTRLTPEEIRT